MTFIDILHTLSSIAAISMIMVLSSLLKIHLKRIAFKK